MNYNNLTKSMFRSRNDHGDIKVGDLCMWPTCELDDRRLGGPFIVYKIENDNFFIKIVPNVVCEIDVSNYPLNDTYLLWYRPKKVCVVICE